jgi:hypothetical protein
MASESGTAIRFLARVQVPTDRAALLTGIDCGLRLLDAGGTLGRVVGTARTAGGDDKRHDDRET